LIADHAVRIAGIWWHRRCVKRGAQRESRRSRISLAAVGAQMDWMPLTFRERRLIAYAQSLINSPVPAGLAAIRRALGEPHTSSELSASVHHQSGQAAKSIDRISWSNYLPDTPEALATNWPHPASERRRGGIGARYDR
jgi:hypothetical protein